MPTGRCESAGRAGIAQLVERHLAKVEVASSRLVSRSILFPATPNIPPTTDGRLFCVRRLSGRAPMHGSCCLRVCGIHRRCTPESRPPRQRTRTPPSGPPRPVMSASRVAPVWYWCGSRVVRATQRTLVRHAGSSRDAGRRGGTGRAAARLMSVQGGPGPDRVGPAGWPGCVPRHRPMPVLFCVCAVLQDDRGTRIRGRFRARAFLLQIAR